MRLTVVLRAVMTFVIVAVTSIVITASPAAAAGCRAAPYSATLTNYPVTYPPTGEHNYYYNWAPAYPGTYTTTTQCSDIQIRSTNGWAFYACVVFTKYSQDSCNYISYVPGNGSWVNIATNVNDYTKFRVGLISYYDPRYVSAVLEF